jgi:hypothetical protein
VLVAVGVHALVALFDKKRHPLTPSGV